MSHEPGPVEPSTGPAPGGPTFLGSGTAPDQAQVRHRLHQIHTTSRRRKTCATYAVATGTLLALALAQHAALHRGSGTQS